MWSGQDKVWTHYTHNVMAADAIDAHLLVKYLNQVTLQRLFLSTVEVIDLQRYKILKQPGKIHNAFQSRIHLPFIFIAAKN
ncbi:MAG: hypothetical protein K0R82_1976 [Flavipsychrobacter sp.]|jgi:hypothetical protein|nr:hypothetical protein [Flavipsychrobacter sp.]